MVMGSRYTARGFKAALRRELMASQPSCSLVVPYRSMCRRQCMASQLAAEKALAASSSLTSTITRLRSDLAPPPSPPPPDETMSPPIICTVR